MMETAGDLRLNFRSSVFDLSEDDLRVYSRIGYVLSELANLDFAIDEFIFAIVQERPGLAKKIARAFPYSFSDKIDFVTNSYILLPVLRELGDYDGNMNINWLCYGLEQVYSFRNVFVHGRIVMREIDDNAGVITVEKVSRKTKLEAEIEVYKYGLGYLEDTVNLSSSIRMAVRRAVEMLKRPEEMKKKRDELLRGHSVLRAFEPYIVDDNGRKLMQLVPQVR